MNARLEDRTSESNLVVTVLAVVAAALYLAFTGWLIAVEVTDSSPSHLPTVKIDNQTHLTLEVQLVDRHGARLTLGAHQPGLTSRAEVADLGRSWTFESSYGGRQVDRQTLDRATLARQGWTVRIPTTAASALERAGYQ
jgi:hypothetical protein